MPFANSIPWIINGVSLYTLFCSIQSKKKETIHIREIIYFVCQHTVSIGIGDVVCIDHDTWFDFEIRSNNVRLIHGIGDYWNDGEIVTKKYESACTY